jgi:hypothetical protein
MDLKTHKLMSAQEIEKVFAVLGIATNKNYSDIFNHEKTFERVSLYKSEGIIYTTDSGTGRCQNS